MKKEQIYTRKEISKILSKASEIQKKKELYGDREGLSEQELLGLAQEVGIESDALLEAIETLNNPVFEQKFKWLSATSRIQNVSISNGEINENIWNDVIAEIRKETGGIGKTSIFNNVYEWEQRRKEFGYKHITLTPHKGKTKIQYVHNWTAMKIAFLFLPAFLGSVFMLIALKGIGFPKTTAAMYAPLGGLIAFTGGLTFMKYYFNREKNRLKNMISAISKKITSSNASRITIEDEEVYTNQNESTKSGSKTR